VTDEECAQIEVVRAQMLDPGVEVWIDSSIAAASHVVLFGRCLDGFVKREVIVIKHIGIDDLARRQPLGPSRRTRT
jgi:hypothetical protein